MLVMIVLVVLIQGKQLRWTVGKQKAGFVYPVGMIVDYDCVWLAILCLLLGRTISVMEGQAQNPLPFQSVAPGLGSGPTLSSWLQAW